MWLPPTGDLARNPGMYPDWESNQRPFASWPTLTPQSHTSQGTIFILTKAFKPHTFLALHSLINIFCFLFVLPSLCFFFLFSSLGLLFLIAFTYFVHQSESSHSTATLSVINPDVLTGFFELDQRLCRPRDGRGRTCRCLPAHTLLSACV